MQSWHLHIEGQVQGVGFRPFVYRLAVEEKLSGEVSNGVDGVHVRFNAAEDQARHFTHRLLAEAPALSRITSHHLQQISAKEYPAFRIVPSEDGGTPRLLLTPDFALCDTCRGELYQPGNPREGYAFTTCTYCGPRYSIIRALPYDRPATHMAPYDMCPSCRREYEDPLDRRYHSQTNSCPRCGVKLQWYLVKNGRALPQKETQEAIPGRAAELLREGGILAVKGIGGYLLMCDATREEAVKTLRDRKRRPDKPFALLYPDLELLEGDVFLEKEEADTLQSPEAPIVLLPLRPAPASGLCARAVAPGLDRIGVMLPYAPLLELIMQVFGRPAVATSGNLSGSPIVYQDEQALQLFPAVADAILANDRLIEIPQDDSVLQYTPYARQRILLRRSRGLAPNLVQPGMSWSDNTRLATGGMLKSSVGLLYQGQIYLSQYLGDLDHLDTQRNYRHVAQHLLSVFQAGPETVLCDLHPDYFSTRYARELAEQWSVPLQRVQHHKAHFAAILGEHGLQHTEEPVLGVIWDGTGYGEDGQVWGSEFFRWENGEMHRCAHLDYYPHILRDKMAREPRISALASGWPAEEVRRQLRPLFSEAEWRVYHHLLEGEPKLQTSSMGRLFDAVAALLHLISRSTYEGQAAMLLERQARDFLRKQGLKKAPPFDVFSGGGKLSAARLLEMLQSAQARGASPAELAARFHLTLVQWVRRVAEREGIRSLAFSGGVFQNALLVDLLQEELGRDHRLLFHRQLSPNDENIAYGQLVAADLSAD